MLLLKWRTHKKRGTNSDILKRIVLTDPLFNDHLHPLFPNGLEVLARHKVPKAKVVKDKGGKHKVQKKRKQNKPRKGQHIVGGIGLSKRRGCHSSSIHEPHAMFPGPI